MGTSGGNPADVGRSLTDYLADVTDAPGLTLAEPPAMLTGGYVNQIYAVGFLDEGCPAHLRGDLVLRLAPPWSMEGKMPREHGVHERVFECGYPTPEPLLLELDVDVLGGPFQLMRRARGAPLVDQILKRPWAAPGLMATMADLLHRLHTLPTNGFAPIVGTTDERYVDPVTTEPAPGAVVADWLSANRPAAASPVLCHLDFHPVNVLFEKDTPTAVIDWENAALGDPVHDVADAALIFIAGPTDIPSVLRPAESAVRRFLMNRFVRRYRSLRPFDEDRFRYFTVLSASRRMIGALHDGADENGLARGLSSPEYITALAAVIEERTGVAPVTTLRG